MFPARLSASPIFMRLFDIPSLFMVDEYGSHREFVRIKIKIMRNVELSC